MPTSETTFGIVSPLTTAHSIERFSSGDPVRDRWLRDRALGNQQTGDTRSYVLARPDGQVIGFYALAVSSLLRTLLPGAMRRNAPDPVSCVVLAQLAVTSEHQNTGLSRRLVLHAMGQVLKLVDIAGCRLFAVHPGRPELFGYYTRFGFRLLTTSPPLMAVSVASVREILAEAAESDARAHSRSASANR